MWYSCLSVTGRLRRSLHPLNFQKLHLRAAACCAQTSNGVQEIHSVREAGIRSRQTDRLPPLSTDGRSLCLSLALGISLSLSESASSAGKAALDLMDSDSAGQKWNCGGQQAKLAHLRWPVGYLLEIYYHCTRKRKQKTNKQKKSFCFSFLTSKESGESLSLLVSVMLTFL